MENMNTELDQVTDATVILYLVDLFFFCFKSW